MDHSMMDMDMGGHSMAMSFHFSESATILFDFWKTKDVGSLLGSIVLVFFMGVAYEGLKYLREFLQSRNRRHQPAPYRAFPTPTPADSDNAESTPPPVSHQPKQRKTFGMFESSHFIQTALHFIQFVLSYFLMLIFMTYNVWLCLGVACGVTVGYFFFGWQRQGIHDPNEHCH